MGLAQGMMTELITDFQRDYLNALAHGKVAIAKETSTWDEANTSLETLGKGMIVDIAKALGHLRL